MGKIHKLNKNLIPKIAAGEVVDRPTSVIKELLDNSIDAKAKNIYIQIEEGGKNLIKIVDDGEGMIKTDLEKCYLPFTTSKISKEEHLNNIETLGFRGEALNSISSISKVSIKTRHQNETIGNELIIDGGKRKKIKPIGMDKGTVIEIRDLFFNVPARKKFLKSVSSEVKQILYLLEKYSLSNWDKSFIFISNNKELLNLKKCNNLAERLEEIYGSRAKNILEINNSNEYLKIEGFIGAPGLSSYTNINNAIFVNNRYIENKKISRAVKQAYGKLIESNSQPFYVLFLYLMPSLVNVNIHPQKKEVNFWNDLEVENFIVKSIKNTLENKAITYDTDYFGNPLRKASKNQFEQLKEETFNWNIKGIEEKNDYEEIFQIGNTYIVTHTKEGMVLIDQHAAHESILYEQYLKQYINKETNIDVIESNELIEVTNTLKFEIENNLEILNTYGFEISNFGGNTFKISQIPNIFKSHDILKLIEELLENTRETHNNEKYLDEKSRQTIAFLSCRGAIKAGEKLTKEEMVNLCHKLEESQGYLTCPHGRPTKIVIQIKDMEKIFKRI